MHRIHCKCYWTVLGYRAPQYAPSERKDPICVCQLRARLGDCSGKRLPAREGRNSYKSSLKLHDFTDRQGMFTDDEFQLLRRTELT